MQLLIANQIELQSELQRKNIPCINFQILIRYKGFHVEDADLNLLDFQMFFGIFQ